jgi:hypothetical protein
VTTLGAADRRPDTVGLGDGNCARLRLAHDARTSRGAMQTGIDGVS